MEGMGKRGLLSDGRMVMATFLIETRSKLSHVKCTNATFERLSQRESASIPKMYIVMLKSSKRTR